jgi:uncharacterized membrane protein
MLPSTKIFIGITVIITGSLLAGLSPFWMAKMQSESASSGASDDEIQTFSHHFMVMQVGMTALIAIGLIVFLSGIYSTARLVESININTKPTPPPPEARADS